MSRVLWDKHATACVPAWRLLGDEEVDVQCAAYTALRRKTEAMATAVVAVKKIVRLADKPTSHQLKAFGSFY